MTRSNSIRVLFTGYAPVHYLCFRPLFQRMIEAGGFDVVSIDGLACADIDSIAQSGLDEIRRVFRDVDRPDAEALVQVGTGLPVLKLVDELEGMFEKPVIACNAAVYWQTLRETGIDDKIAGFGRLLAEC